MPNYLVEANYAIIDLPDNATAVGLTLGIAALGTVALKTRHYLPRMVRDSAVRAGLRLRR